MKGDVCGDLRDDFVVDIIHKEIKWDSNDCPQINKVSETRIWQHFVSLVKFSGHRHPMDFNSGCWMQDTNRHWSCTKVIYKKLIPL
jgi:hypothetical protein